MHLFITSAFAQSTPTPLTGYLNHSHKPTKLQPTKNYLRHPHTAPTTPDVHYNNIYNARHLMPKTQIMPNLKITVSVFTAPNTTGSDHLYNTLELLMMRIMLPGTCWASNKICNKYHLLHLVGILFPHINFNCVFIIKINTLPRVCIPQCILIWFPIQNIIPNLTANN